MQRRQFLGTLSLAGLTALTGGVNAQQVGLDAGEFTPVPVWSGLADARPAPDSEHLSGLEGRIIYWAIDTGAVSYIDEPGGQWDELPTSLPGYATADLPTDLPTSTLLFDTNRNLPTWWDTDHWEFPNFVDDVKTSPVTVENTTTRTTVFNPDINADSLVKGRKYQIQLSGSFSTTNNSDTFTVFANLAGATDLADIGNAPANATNKPWWVQVEFSVREHGQNGVVVPTTFGVFDSVAQQADNAHGTVSVDTTTATNLSVDIEWSAADPDNSVTVDQAHLIQMG